MKRLTTIDSKRALGTWVASVAVVVIAASPAVAATIKVNTTLDEYGTGSDCSLREAVQAANTDTAYGGCVTGEGADTIRIRGGKTYIREQAGVTYEDQNVSGDYDIQSSVRIEVGGKGRAVLSAGGFDRVLTVFNGASLEASKLIVRDGVTYPGGQSAGGGIQNGGSLKLTNSVITENEALEGCACGGGLGTTNSSATSLDRVTITENEAANLGGGLSLLGGALEMRRSSMMGNSTTYGGGGVSLVGSGDSARIRSSTITGNEATDEDGDAGGGGVYVYDDSDTKISIENSTITGNETNGVGGGVWQDSGSLTLNAVTVTDNTVDANASGPGGGGGIAGGATVTNSIVAGNFDVDPANADCLESGSVSDSLTGNDTGCPSGNRTTTKPRLGPLANNGGPTKTIALKKGSPAINRAGSGMPRNDQRGRKRDRKPDLGAYER